MDIVSLRDNGRIPLFEFGHDDELGYLVVITDAQHIRLAADLAVFDVALRPAGGGVHRGFIPFATSCTLKSLIAHSLQKDTQITSSMTAQSKIGALGIF